MTRKVFAIGNTVYSKTNGLPFVVTYESRMFVHVRAITGDVYEWQRKKLFKAG